MRKRKGQRSEASKRKDEANEMPQEADEKKIVKPSKEEGRLLGGAKWLRKRRDEGRTRGE